MYLRYQGQFAQLPVYVITNLGFYESEQGNVLLEIVKNWCSKMGFFYGGGLAIGAGEMLGTLKKVPLDQGPNQQLGKASASLLKLFLISDASRIFMWNQATFQEDYISWRRIEIGIK